MKSSPYLLTYIVGLILIGILFIGMIRNTIDEIVGTKLIISIFIVLVIIRAVQAIQSHKDHNKTDKY